MSLLDPTKHVEALPSLTVAQRQAIIDRGEAHVAGIIGRGTHNDVTTGATPETETAKLESGGGVIEEAGVPIEDPADDKFIGSPLGARTVLFDIYSPSDGVLLELPNGPLTSIADILIDGIDTPVENFAFRPWSLRYRDNRTCFFRGQHIEMTAITGFTRDTAPAQFTEAIILAIDVIRSKSAAGGALKSLSKTAEQLGPYRATFGEVGAGSNAIRDNDFKSAEGILREMIAPWTQPGGFF